MLSEFYPGGEGIADSDRGDGSNLIDNLLLYHITGRETDKCMERWRLRSLPPPYEEEAATQYPLDLDDEQ